MTLPASGPGQYLCWLWDNTASTSPVTLLEKRLAKRGLITISKPSPVFGHVTRQITDEGRKVRDEHVATVATTLSSWIDDVLDAADQMVVTKPWVSAETVQRRGLITLTTVPDGKRLKLTAFGRAVLKLRRERAAAMEKPS